MDLVGKRILYRFTGHESIFEGIVKDVSPSGKYIKICNQDRCEWYDRFHIDVVEVLGDESPYSGWIKKIDEINKKYEDKRISVGVST